MDATELRALADALEPMARAPRFEDFDVPAFCAWVRACADEKPVGVYVHRPAELRYGVEWLVGDPMPNGTQLFTHPAPTEPQADAQPVAWSDGLGSFIAADERVGDDPDILAYRVPLYTHPAPAAPHPAVQAGWQLVPVKPTLGMNNAGLSAVNQYGKRLVWETYKAMLAAAPAAPQAEPKREPLSNRRIGELWNQAWSIAGITDEFRMIEFVRLVERAHGIGGSDAGAD